MLSECLGLAFLLKWLIELGINVVIEKWCDLKKSVGVIRAPGVASKS